MERDLLCRDRGHERLERIRRERRPVAGKPTHGLSEYRIAPGKLDERRQVELEPEELAHGRLDRLVEGLDVDAAPGARDPYLPSRDDPVETAVQPDGRAVHAPEGEAVKREVEVVRLRNSQKAQNSPAAQVFRWTRAASGLNAATKRLFAAVALAFDRAASVKLAFFGAGQPAFACALSKNASR